MAEVKVNTFYVSEKISKVRWVPEQHKESERFLSGCWDMPANFVRIWRLQKNQYVDDYNEYVPRCSDKFAMPGDVTGMEFVTDETAVVSCADGEHSYTLYNSGTIKDSTISRTHYIDES